MNVSILGGRLLSRRYVILMRVTLSHSSPTILLFGNFSFVSEFENVIFLPDLLLRTNIDLVAIELLNLVFLVAFCDEDITFRALLEGIIPSVSLCSRHIVDVGGFVALYI